MAGVGAGVPGRARAVRLVGALAFVLTPWVTFGFGTAAAFAVVALRYGRLGRVPAVVLWSSSVVYAVAQVVALAASDSVEGSAGDVMFTSCVLVGIVGGGLEALALTVWAIVHGYRAPPARNRTCASGDGSTAPAAAGDPSARRARSRHLRGSSRAGRIIGAVLLVVYVAFLTPVVVSVLLGDIAFRDHHSDALATVVSVRRDSSCSGYPVPSCTDQYYPTVVFTAAGAGTVQAETRDARAGGGAPVAAGDRIAVHYDPGDLRDVRLGTGWDATDTLLVIVTVLTYVMIGIGALGALRRRRRRRAGGPPPARRA